MIKTNYQNNDYQTPRRRHSSLFQRMEDEINKISKKLSAAKQHRQSQTHSRKNTLAHPPPFNPLLSDTPEETVRYKQTQYGSKELTRKYNCLADRTNLKQPATRAPIRRLRFGFEQSEGHEIRKLQEQNRTLVEQVKMLKTVCEEQAFKVGYMRAESRQREVQHEQERANLKKQQVYLSKLAESYKIKIEKYKRLIGDDQSLELSLSDL